jgi:hypothetical protein
MAVIHKTVSLHRQRKFLTLVLGLASNTGFDYQLHTPPVLSE